MSKGNESGSDAGALPFSVTLHVRDTCMCLHLQRAARAVARRFDEALRPHGLTNGQFSLLMSLNRPAPPLMRDVADLLAMDRTSLTAMLKPLQRRGLLSIEQDAKDRRGKRLTLLPQGRELLARAVPDWMRTEAEVEAVPGLADAEALRDELRAVSRA
jgi:DNA-binding MarR family transcriptional regulator